MWEVVDIDVDIIPEKGAKLGVDLVIDIWEGLNSVIILVFEVVMWGFREVDIRLELVVRSIIWFWFLTRVGTTV